jgi:hypothetical protein
MNFAPIERISSAAALLGAPSDPGPLRRLSFFARRRRREEGDDCGTPLELGQLFSAERVDAVDNVGRGENITVDNHCSGIAIRIISAVGCRSCAGLDAHLDT